MPVLLLLLLRPCPVVATAADVHLPVVEAKDQLVSLAPVGRGGEEAVVTAAATPVTEVLLLLLLLLLLSDPIVLLLLLPPVELV